jgi:predicted O-methyltransferase YrrM/uncharacterized Rossmann fold enzyme
MPQPKILKIEDKIKVTYCIPTWLRDEQIKLNTARVKGRIAPHYEKRNKSIALVNFGPSLNDTWEQIKNFEYIMTCSGAHNFLVERGIIPTHHIDVDPRPHKVKLIGTPQKGTEYLIASTCHPTLFEHLKDFDVKLWHIFDTSEDGLRLLPAGEWAITGGCSVGVRTLTLARFLGFTDLHIFGMDGCEGKSGKHADIHPNQPKTHALVEYEGVTYKTTAGMLEAAKNTWHELDLMKDVTAKFYGEGLVQAMSKRYQRKEVKGDQFVGFSKPELISAAYRELNSQLHNEELAYGVGGGKFAPIALKLSESLKTTSILDYGCGKGYLAKALPFPIWEYDPAIPGKEESPRPADIVICTDVLEHIEPDHLPFVLDDLRRCVKKVGLFVICSGAAKKTYSNGMNTHLIQQNEKEWGKKLSEFFTIGSARSILLASKEKSWDGEDHFEVHFVVGPKLPSSTSVRRWHVLEALAKQRGWTSGAEIGVKEGFTFLHLLEQCPNLILTGVDIFESRLGIEVDGGESFAEAHLPEHEARLRKTIATSYPGRGILIKGYSTDAAKSVEDASLDFVFIDADHREESVLADIAAWRPKIKVGGMLLGHDAQEKFPGVLKAINTSCPGWVQHPDSVWSYQC